MKVISSRSKSTSPTKVVNFLILLTFKINDFGGHYLKLQGFTSFGLKNIFYFNDNYIIDDRELIAK